MKLTVIGCSGSGPGPDSPASSYLVEHDGFRLVIDLGNGSLGQLARHTDPRSLDAILLSHLHSDHCLDACALMVVHRFHPAGQPAPIPLYGPAGTTQRLLAACDPGASTLADVYAVEELRVGTRAVGPFEVRTARMRHPVETYGIRLTAGGTSLTYSADTGDCPDLVELAGDTDLLLCEASFVEPRPGEAPNPPNLHLTGREAGEHAAAAGVGRLLITHIPMWNDPVRVLDEASGPFPKAELACGGASYEI